MQTVNKVYYRTRSNQNTIGINNKRHFESSRRRGRARSVHYTFFRNVNTPQKGFFTFSELTSRRRRIERSSRRARIDVGHLRRVGDQHPPRGDRLALGDLSGDRGSRHDAIVLVLREHAVVAELRNAQIRGAESFGASRDLRRRTPFGNYAAATPVR